MSQDKFVERSQHRQAHQEGHAAVEGVTKWKGVRFERLHVIEGVERWRKTHKSIIDTYSITSTIWTRTKD